MNRYDDPQHPRRHRHEAGAPLRTQEADKSQPFPPSSRPGTAAHAPGALMGPRARAPRGPVMPAYPAHCWLVPPPQVVPPTGTEIPLGPLTSLEPFNSLVIPGSGSPSPLPDVTVAILEPPPGPSLPPTLGMEPGTPVLSLDWMTSPSCREPWRSWPTKDTVAMAPAAHLPSRLQPGREDSKGAGDGSTGTGEVTEVAFPRPWTSRYSMIRCTLRWGMGNRI